MRRFLSLFVLLALTWVVAGSQKIEPVFSTEGALQYVRIQFKTGEAFLQDNGDGLSMRTYWGAASVLNTGSNFCAPAATQVRVRRTKSESNLLM